MSESGKDDPPPLLDIADSESEPQSDKEGTLTPEHGQSHHTNSDDEPQPLRQSTRIKNLTAIGKQSKCLQLGIDLSKQISQHQKVLDATYDQLHTLNTAEAIENTLSNLNSVLSNIESTFNELYTLSDNKLDEVTTKLYNDYEKEVQALQDEMVKKIAVLQNEQAQAEEERELKRMEEQLAILQQQLAEQHQLHQTMQASRTHSRRNRFRESDSETPGSPTTQALHIQADSLSPPPDQRTMHSTAQAAPQLMLHTPKLQNSPANTRMSMEEKTTPTHSHNNNGLDVVKELTQSLVLAMKTSKHSSPEPGVYEGNPIEFRDWELDFDAYIESEGLTEIEALRHLKRFIKGRAKEAVSGHFITNSVGAYRDARSELKERFGSKHNVNRALRKKLEDWPKIGVKDASGLRKFADFLSHVRSAMRDVPELESLNHSQENEKLAAKLPDWIIRSWARKVKEKRQSEYGYPKFYEFVGFVVDQAEVMNEPLMRSLNGREHQRDRESSNKKIQGASSNIRTFATSSSASRNSSCRCCKKMHATTECYTLTNMSEECKEKFVKENLLCFSCLEPNHQSRQCTQRATCKKCAKHHPTALHREPQDWRSKPPTNNQQPLRRANNNQDLERPVDTKEMKTPELPEPKVEPKRLESKSTSVERKILSMVVPVHISTSQDPSSETLVYALLDTQSDSSYITNATAKIINPDHTKERVTISTLTGETTDWIKLYNNLQIRGYNQPERTALMAYEWNNLTCNRQQIPNNVNVQLFAHLKDHAHKLPPPLDIPVGLLIGADCPQAFEPLESVSGEKGQPFAQRTMLGWTVLGGSTHCQHKKTTQLERTDVKATTTVSNISTDDSDEITMISQEDLQFLNIMKKGTHRSKSGSYEMPLPFQKRPVLPNNKAQAEKRVTSLKKKLDADEMLSKEYHAFMDALVEMGHAELASHQPTAGEVWYIPHFAVKHPKKSKIRVVFDCSATYGGTSLNDHLLQGPDLTNNMLGILLRFRKEAVAIACDVEKMFYNFHVDEKDRDYLRFLWYGKDGSLKEYRMTVHLFGATSSPAVATYGLRTLADSDRDSYPMAAQFINRDFYVDDGITSVNTVEAASNLIKDSRDLCRQGNMRLHKFVSNHPAALKDIPESEKSIKDIDLFTDCDTTQRTLGLEWSVKDDSLNFTSSKFEKKPATRRGVLSTVSQLYDPLGLLAPFTLVGKNILQKINKVNQEWDKEIPPDTVKPWNDWILALENLEDIKIPRCIKPTSFGKAVRVELHHFSDASSEGLGACSYIRMINEANEVHTSLLLAKSRVVPSKGIVTIPRLELQAAVMATRLSSILRKELDMEISQEFFWTDSEIVLAYIANEKKKFHVFVANRVHEIKMATTASQWHHVSSSDNPADIASRGLGCNELLHSMWFTGPSFLQKTDLQSTKLQMQLTNPELRDDDPEVKKVKRVKVAQTQASSLFDRFVKFSNFDKLVTAIAYLEQLAKKKTNKHKYLSLPSLSDMDNSRKLVIKAVQKKHFFEEMQALEKGKSISNMSSILNLNPFLGKDGLIRVGGRATKSSLLSEDEKHPIVIPKDNHIAMLLITKFHEETHMGRAYTLNKARANGYWIISGSKMTKEIVEKCVRCKKGRGVPIQQMMGELPEDRLQATPPFTMVGIDCFGPFTVKERRTELKRYGLLFTCLYSRAIHIEALDDLSTDSFINALRCFLAVRGVVKKIYCDHGTNFMGARNEMAKQLLCMTNDAVKRYIKNMQIEFVTTTPTASHQGGVWERQIRTIRSILHNTLHKYRSRLDTTSLRTIFYEIAAIVNHRPLSKINLNDHEELPLTPNMILTGKSEATPPPPGDFDNEDLYSRLRWRQVQAVADEFWIKWKNEYLSDITKRQKWKTSQENLKIGNLVLLVERDQPRNYWRIGIVEQVQKGEDGLVRSATVRLGNKWLDNKGRSMEKSTTLQRPVQKLVKLM